MKIKFLKPFRLYNPIGDCMMITEGAIENMEKEDYAQWLIDNGFAEEAKEYGWKPKYNEEYFYIGHDGSVHPCLWANDPLDNGRLKLGFVFKTEEATARYGNYLKAVATVRQDEGVIDLQGIGEEYETTPENKYNDFSVYTVAFDLYLRKLVVIDADEYISANAIWFDTEEHAQSSLDNHPDEWKRIVNYDWGRETEYVYKERYAELSNNGKEDK